MTILRHLPRSRSLVLALTTASSLAGPALAQRMPLDRRIQRVIDRPEFAHAMWGIQFTSLDSNRVVFALNETKLFTPGSTTKLLTEGTALGVLGADHRFTTRVYRTGPVRAGVLEGDLVLLASGDPNLSGRLKPDGTLAFENVDHAYDADPNTRAVPGDPLLVLKQLAGKVRQSGITRVRGSVIVDASLFPEGDRELGTGVVISPVVVNDNLVDLTIGPGADSGATASLAVSPTTSYVRFINKVVTVKPGTRPSIRWSSDSLRPDGSRVVVASGVFPRGTAPILYSYAVPEPSRYRRGDVRRSTSIGGRGGAAAGLRDQAELRAPAVILRPGEHRGRASVGTVRRRGEGHAQGQPEPSREHDAVRAWRAERVVTARRPASTWSVNSSHRSDSI